MSKQGLIRDLTDVETIYTARPRTMRVKLGASDGSKSVRNACLKTIRIKRRARYDHGAEHEIITITDLTDVEHVLDSVFATLEDDQEHYLLLILDGSNALIGYKVMASGPGHACNLDPKLMFRSALLLGAQRVILAHNHPSRCTRPEPLDVLLTRTLVLAGRVIEIEVLDHIIYTPKEQLSMREHMSRLFEKQDQPAGSPE